MRNKARKFHLMGNGRKKHMELNTSIFKVYRCEERVNCSTKKSGTQCCKHHLSAFTGCARSNKRIMWQKHPKPWAEITSLGEEQGLGEAQTEGWSQPKSGHLPCAAGSSAGQGKGRDLQHQEQRSSGGMRLPSVQLQVMYKLLQIFVGVTLSFKE